MHPDNAHILDQISSKTYNTMVSTPLSHLVDLQFNTAGLLKEAIGSTRVFAVTVTVSQLDQIDESFDVTAPFIGTVHFLKTNNSVLTHLSGHTTLKMICARCLEPFEQEFTIEIEEEFLPSIDIATGSVIPHKDDDEALLINEHHILDLTELLRQAIILSLPLTPLCQDDCKGLCPTCGINRNYEVCDCQDEHIDPRWASLSILLKNNQDSTSLE